MKFKSIQFSVAALAGAIVLSVVAALVLYALFSGARTQDMVQERTQAQFEQVIEQRLTSLAQTQVSQIQRELEAPLLIAGGLVRVNALIGTPGADGQPTLSLSREQLISLIKENVAKNPKILGTYIGWEKDALDHNDAAYVDTKVVGIDASNGRFLPWWFRNEDGTLGLDKLVVQSLNLSPQPKLQAEQNHQRQAGQRRHHQHVADAQVLAHLERQNRSDGAAQVDQRVVDRVAEALGLHCIGEEENPGEPPLRRWEV